MFMGYHDSPNCAFDLWSNPQTTIDNRAFTAYAGSLFNIGKELAETHARTEKEQEKICNRWGRSLNDLTDNERTYIEQVCGEFNSMKY